MEIVKEDGTLSSNIHEIMSKWKDYFQGLLNPRTDSEARESYERTDNGNDSENKDRTQYLNRHNFRRSC